MNRKYTASQLAFIKRRRRLPRRDLLVAFRRKFTRGGMTLLRLQDLCNRYGWAVGSRKGRLKGRSLRYSKAELAYIRRRRKMPRRELHAAFVEKFERAISLDGFKALCDRLRLRTGRTGRFEKGSVPANKGQKRPYNANSARTQFKKGSRTGRANSLYKPIGSTRLSKEGYLERKVHDGLPMQSRWRGAHLINWEKKHGAVPAGHCLKCLDGDKRNTDPSNWELVPRALLPRLNGRFRRGYDEAPADLKPAIMAVAKLEHRLRERGSR